MVLERSENCFDFLYNYRRIKMKHYKKISLVLGSGGARGYAHIGVIEELEKQGYKIVSISGSSMGALVGGLYACGKLDAYKKWVLGMDAMDIASLLDFSMSHGGLIEGDKVFREIRKMVGEINIETLPIKFTAVATDIVKQKEIWFQNGDLVDAIRASIAIPSVFTPVRREGMILIDGGVLNPLPISPTLSDINDQTIAVNLNAQSNKKYSIDIPLNELEKESSAAKIFFEMAHKAQTFFFNDKVEKKEEMNILQIMGKTIDVMQNAVLKCKMAGYSPDIIIDVPHDSCDFYEFHKAYNLIEIGKMIAKDHFVKESK
jgi:NTE family protein